MVDDAVKAPWKLVAPLKATVGTMNDEVPKDTDVSEYRSIVASSDSGPTATFAGQLGTFGPVTLDRHGPTVI